MNLLSIERLAKNIHSSSYHRLHPRVFYSLSFTHLFCLKENPCRMKFNSEVKVVKNVNVMFSRVIAKNHPDDFSADPNFL